MKLNLKTALMVIVMALLPVAGFGAKSVAIKGNVYDRVTTKHLPDSEVTILTQDSMQVATVVANERMFERQGGEYMFLSTGSFSIEVPDTLKKFIVKATHEGYEPLYHNVDFSGEKGRKIEHKLPPLYLTPEGKTKQLDDVVVTATKIKFYHKGDTVVYNADAFQLPEGSMLDALLEQLPGVEFRDGGEIYVNGKKVESLLLNGKDFFRGNQQVLRENIGAYTVKTIEAYDKYDELSRLIGKKIEGQSEYVLDVKLKKDYMGGYMGNIEAGYGTHGRYLGRLFGMHFNNNARYSIYANLNNLNRLQRPSSGQGFVFSDDRSRGLNNLVNGGLDYSVEDPLKVWQVNGNVDVKYKDNLVASNTLTESYVAKTYEPAYARNRNFSFDIYTNHRFDYRKDNLYFRVDPEFKYNRTHSASHSLSALFNEYVQDNYEVNRKLIETLYSVSSPQQIREAVVNRNNYIRRNRSNSWSAGVFNENTFKFRNTPNILSVWLEGNYKRLHDSSDATQLVDYGYNPEFVNPFSSMVQRRDAVKYPQYDYYFKGAARYFINYKDFSYSFCYEYRREETRKTNEEYLFESIADNTEALLPDIYQLLPDLPNTTSSKSFNNIHMLKFRFNHTLKLEKDWSLSTSADIQYHITGRRLNYEGYQAGNDAGTYNPVYIPISRVSGNIKDSEVSLYLRRETSLRRQIFLKYQISTDYASLIDMVDLPNTVDPLNISKGNPNLKNALRQSLALDTYFKFTGTSQLFFQMFGGIMSNAIARGYDYNSETGVREYKSYNVSGAKWANMWAFYTKSFGPKQQFEFGTHFSYQYSRNVDMIGVDGPALKRFVYNNVYNGTVQLKYEIPKLLRGNVSFTVNTNTSRSAGIFNTRYSLVPGAYVFLQWPKNFQITANYGYCRNYGFADKGTRNYQHVLNAAITYLLNKNWSFTASGNDLLNYGATPNYSVNSQGRILSYTNVLPRYFLFSVTYKFNTKNK